MGYSSIPPGSGRRAWYKLTHHPVWSAVIAGLIVLAVVALVHKVTNSGAPGSPSPGPSSTGGQSGTSSPSPTVTPPSPTPSSPSRLPRVFVGKWQGSIVQYNTSSRYSAILSLRSGSVGSPVGTSKYPALECEGTLRLQAINGSKVLLTEYITEQLGAPCVTPQPLALKFNKNGTLTYQILSDDTDFAKVLGQGTLRHV